MRAGVCVYAYAYQNIRQANTHNVTHGRHPLGGVAEGGELVLAQALLLPGQGDEDLEGAQLLPGLELLVLLLVREVVDACERGGGRQ